METNYLVLIARAAERAREDACAETRPKVRRHLREQAEALMKLWNDGFYFKVT